MTQSERIAASIARQLVETIYRYENFNDDPEMIWQEVEMALRRGHYASKVNQTTRAILRVLSPHPYQDEIDDAANNHGQSDGKELV